MKRRYLAVHDYGMGGIWGYVLAANPLEITERYPELQVVEDEPSWITDDLREGLERRVEDIDEPKRLGATSRQVVYEDSERVILA